jgi:drug/metabolite transporter (DMT)-like permease
MTTEQHSHKTGLTGAAAALASALLFGITTPLSKELLTNTHPLLIAGLLYAGSGLGLTMLMIVQDRGRIALGLSHADRPWLLGAVACGGVLAPALLMFGLSRADAAAAALLLNLEVVFTAVIAWSWFREATSSRVVGGFALIFVRSVVLVWPSDPGRHQTLSVSVVIGAACLCWAIDNNLTRRISGGDARALAAAKGRWRGRPTWHWRSFCTPIRTSTATRR